VNEAQVLENEELLLWCVVPAMFHVWPGAEDGSVHVYEHDSPSGARTDNRLCHGSYENHPSYLPDGNEELTLDDLPQSVQQRAMPADVERELEILSDYEDWELYGMTIGEIKSLVQ
jgi:hypothetical protein